MDAFFTADGDAYVPGTMTRGPWGATMGGQIVGGLLGWALDRNNDDDLQPARLTIDLLRPVPIEPVSIETSVLREGRRIKLVDAAMLQHGRIVARASALFLRRSAEPEGQVWTAPVAMPALPAHAEPLEAEVPFDIWTYNSESDSGSAGMPPREWEQPGVQKFAWTRMFRPMVAGHPLTPFTRAAFAGDIISSLTHWSTAGLRYINADYTVAISRLPQGEYIGLAAQSYYGNDGVGSGSATMFDSIGPIGTGTALRWLGQAPDAFKPNLR